MQKIYYFSLFIILFLLQGNLHAEALSPLAEEGKAYFAVCNACHNPDLEPPKAAPFFGIQRKYQRAYGSKQAMVQQIKSYVKQPSEEKALMRNAVKNLGLMPPLELSDEILHKLATYIVEESFAPPCKHWEIAIQRLSNQPAQGRHLEKDTRMYNRFCQ